MSCAATVIRDTVFGGVFAATKHIIAASWIKPKDSNKKSKDFLASMAGGAAGTVFSAPLNFIRNIQYNTPHDQRPPGSWELLRDLFNAARLKDRPFDYVQERLRLGWGTARVAVGMAAGYELYDVFKDLLDHQSMDKARRAIAQRLDAPSLLPASTDKVKDA